ncbi:ProQ/FINO family protein [Aureimonas pseudogalii]|uniref:ProP effector n=1 Tax=Aureimonas pseudogalii TaxID=1744844 RepID=A0A7W6MLV0_9HYPH|nr:ProQ/FINO family protein [Aureimonas pseudogalii]MBB4000139.1 ProP effector [Aureimonas pseudogalii]
MTDTAPKPPALWTKKRGPINATAHNVEVAKTINLFLIAPIAVLPDSTDGIMRPFAIGIGAEIKARMKPDAKWSDVSRAIRKYVRSRSYLFAVAQPDAMRHDIDGNPVEPVSKADRMTAMIDWTSIKTTFEKRKSEQALVDQADQAAAA